MDGTDDGLTTIETLIGIHSCLKHTAVGVGCPAWIAVAMADVGTNHAEGGFNLLCGCKLGTFDRTALAGGNVYLTVVHLDRGKVGGCFDKVFYLAAHG